MCHERLDHFKGWYNHVRRRPLYGVETTDGSYENTQHASFDTFFVGLFEKTRFLDIVKNFICFNVDGQNTFKILAGYHQYFAVKKAIESTKHATVTDGKGGVFWHTQGSGNRCLWSSMLIICKKR